MVNFDQTSIQLITSYSNWSQQSVDKALKDHVYNGSPSWKSFLRFLFLALGVGFTTAGIIFFFAYNWADLHKFVKIGIMEGLVIISTLIVVLTVWKPMVKNIILTGTTFLVGGMIAVFGQIYQRKRQVAPRPVTNSFLRRRLASSDSGGGLPQISLNGFSSTFPTGLVRQN